MKPTDSELEILKVLWSEGPSTVRLVHDILSEQKDVFYTTTLKTMQVMAEKGLLSRDTSQRSHIYDAILSKSKVEKDLITKLANAVFGGSAGKLAISAIGHQKPTKRELEEIKSLIETWIENDK